MSSQEERERLKEEYKQHYKAILESKKKLAQAERQAKIAQALDQINPKPVLDSLHSALGKLREKVTQAEARLEVYMDDEKADELRKNEEAEELFRKQKVKDTLSAIRRDMNELEEEVEHKAAAVESDKTIFTEENQEEAGHGKVPEDIKKTIGRKKDESVDD